MNLSDLRRRTEICSTPVPKAAVLEYHDGIRHHALGFIVPGNYPLKMP